MKNEFRLAIAAILLLLPNAGRAQWLTQSFELKDGWNAIYLHVDASHTDIVEALGYDLSTIDQSPVEQIWAWVPKPNSIQFIQSPQAPVNNSSRWFEWRKDERGTSELKKIRGNHGYLVYVSLPSGQTSHNLEIKGKPVLPRYEWTTSGLNFIGFPTPSISPPNFDQYLVHSPELHRNGEIYLYNGGALSDGTNPARLFSLRSTEVRRGEAMWIRGTAGQYSNYFGPLKVTLQDPDGVHFGDTINQYRVIVRNMTSNPITIKLAPVASEVPPAGQALHIDAPPLVVRGEINTDTLEHDYVDLASSGRDWTLESKGEPGSGVEIILGLDRARMIQFSGERYAGLLRITDSLTDNSQPGVSTTQGMTQIDLQVTASVPSMDGLWVGEALVNEVRHDLTDYTDEEAVQASPEMDLAYLGDKRRLSIAGWARLRTLPSGGDVYGILGEKDTSGNGSYFAVKSDGNLLFQAENGYPVVGKKPIRMNNWNHMAATFSGEFKTNSVAISSIQENLETAIQVNSIELENPPLEILSIEQNNWSLGLSNKPLSTPVVGSDGTVYVGSKNGKLYAVSADGTEKWSFGTGGGVLSKPIIIGNVLYFGSMDKALYAVWIKDGVGGNDNNYSAGDQKWKYTTDGPIESSPAVSKDGDIIYFGSNDSYLYAILINDGLHSSDVIKYYSAGDMKWRFKTGDKVTSSPLVNDSGDVVFGSWDKHLYKLDQNGNEKWKYLTDGEIRSSPVTKGDGSIYIASRDNKIHFVGGPGAYDSNGNPINIPDGTSKFQFAAGGYTDSKVLLIDDGHLIFGASDGYLYCVSVEYTGRPLLRWKINIGSPIIAAPVIVSGGDRGERLHVLSNDGYVHSFYTYTNPFPKEGKIKLKGQLVNTPAVTTKYNNSDINTDKIYAVTSSGYLYSYYSIGQGDFNDFYAANTDVLITTKIPHGINPNEEINIYGVKESDFMPAYHLGGEKLYYVDEVIGTDKLRITIKNPLPEITTDTKISLNDAPKSYDTSGGISVADSSGNQLINEAKINIDLSAGRQCPLEVNDWVVLRKQTAHSSDNIYYTQNVFKIKAVQLEGAGGKFPVKTITIDVSSEATNQTNSYHVEEARLSIVTTSTLNGYATGDVVLISGASNNFYNDHYEIEKLSDNTFGIRKLGILDAADEKGINLKVERTIGIATANTSGKPNYNKGDTIEISGASGQNKSQYNGYKTIDTVGGNSFTFEVKRGVGNVTTTTALKGDKPGTLVMSITEQASSTATAIATATFYSTNVFLSGDYVRFSGSSNTSYNGKTYAITSADENSFTFNVDVGTGGSGECHAELIGQIRIYLNGQEVAMQNNSLKHLQSGSTPTTIGNTGIQGTAQFIGDINNLRIYSQALTIEQVRADYNRQPVKGLDGALINHDAGPLDSWYQGFADPSGRRPLSRYDTFGKVRRPYKLRLLFHRDSDGNTRLLQRVYSGLDKDGRIILSNRESALDASRLALAARMSAVHLPFSTENVPWPCEGTLGLTGNLEATVTTAHDDHAGSPFLHTYHPDHDNRDARFEKFDNAGSGIGRESWKIIRGMRFTFQNQDPGQLAGSKVFGTLDWGSGLIGGEYRELITLVGKQINFVENSNPKTRNETRQYEVRGAFALRRVSDIDKLVIK